MLFLGCTGVMSWPLSVSSRNCQNQGEPYERLQSGRFDQLQVGSASGSVSLRQHISLNCSLALGVSLTSHCSTGDASWRGQFLPSAGCPGFTRCHMVPDRWYLYMGRQSCLMLFLFTEESHAHTTHHGHFASSHRAFVK